MLVGRAVFSLVVLCVVVDLVSSFAMTSKKPSDAAPPRRSQRLVRRALHDEHDDAEGSQQGAAARKPPLVTLGLLADIQYAPIEDGHSYSGTPRYYRHALEAARHAAEHFEREGVALVVNLGDIVDGKAAATSSSEKGESDNSNKSNNNLQAVDDVLEALSVFQSGPMLHVYGNHCLYNMDRTTMMTKLGIPFVKEPCGDLVGYYSHLIANTQIRCVVLDSYDVALLQRCTETSQKRKEAVRLLQHHNSANYQDGNENSPEGLVGVQKRFVAFGGGVGPVQLEWLRNELAAARTNHERVLIFSHQPILPTSSNPVCLMWNYKEVLAVLREYKDVVVASFSGHAHKVSVFGLLNQHYRLLLDYKTLTLSRYAKGGHARDRTSGIHFRVLEAILESPDPHKTYALLDVYHDRLEVRGFGHCQSAVYHLDHQPIMAASTRAQQKP